MSWSQRSIVAKCSASAILLSVSVLSVAVVPASAALLPESSRSVAAAQKGEGSIQVKVKGLPQKARAKVILARPGYRKVVKRSTVVQGLKTGTYRVTAVSVSHRGGRYSGVAKPSTVTVGAKKRVSVTVTYRSTKALKFNFARAVGVAVPEVRKKTSAGSTGKFVRAASKDGELLAVLPDGSTRNAVVKGQLGVILGVVAGPDGRLYVVLDDGGCSLLRVDPVTDKSVCLDEDADIIGQVPSDFSVNPPVQFDGQGAVYYQTATSSGTQLIRNAKGEKTNLINDNIWIENWLVYKDGSVFLGGSTKSSGAQWFRRVLPTGGIQNLASGSRPTTFAEFPDGNIYFGSWGASDVGIRRVMTPTMSVDPVWWLSGSLNAFNPPRTFDIATFCQPVNAGMQGFCSNFGVAVDGYYKTANGEVYGLPSGQGSALMKYFPTVEKASTTVLAEVGESIPGGVALAGLTADSSNVIVKYQTDSGTQTTLVGADQNIEVYHLSYVSISNSLMFDGLRFADGRYVVGSVDLDTGTTSVKPSEKLVALEAFK